MSVSCSAPGASPAVLAEASALAWCAACIQPVAQPQCSSCQPVVCSEPGGQEARLLQLVAQEAGLKAALQLVDGLSQEVKGHQQSAAEQQEEAQAALSALEQLQSEEEVSDGSRWVFVMISILVVWKQNWLLCIKHGCGGQAQHPFLPHY